jgi:hypothetical protein
MVATDVKETRRRLNELAETQHWVHHVADLDSGKILTFPLDRPVTPLSRAERLSRLGHSFDPSIFGGIFGGPSYSLSPNHPHNDSPLAGLSVSGADIFDAFRDQVIWSPPQNTNDANFIFRQINFTLTVSPSARSLASINLSGKAWPGMVGHLRVLYKNGSLQIPIDAYVSHTVDLTFDSGNQFASIAMTLEAGIQLLEFDSMSLVTLPPLLELSTF